MLVLTYSDSWTWTILSSIFDNSDSIEIGRVSEGVIGTFIFDSAFSSDIFHDEGNTPDDSDSFTSSSNAEEIVQNTGFSIATDKFSSPQLLEEDAINTAHSCSQLGNLKVKFKCTFNSWGLEKSVVSFVLDFNVSIEQSSFHRALGEAALSNQMVQFPLENKSFLFYIIAK